MPDNQRPRRRPRTREVMQKIRALENLRETPENRAALPALADALALWSHQMILSNPAAAAHVYGALVTAWDDNRAELEADSNPANRAELVSRECETVPFHVLFIRRFNEVFAWDAHKPTYPAEKRAWADLWRFRRWQLTCMLERLSGGGDAPPPVNTNAERVAELRAELGRLGHLPENEAARFKAESEIYRLEREEEWPDLIGA
jgi:hypothetical protein